MSARAPQHRAPLRRAIARHPRISAFVAGLLVASGQKPLGLEFLALVGLMFGVVLWRRAETWKAAAWVGWSLGFGAFLGALNWIVHPFFVEPLRHGWMAPFALFFMCGGLALLWSAAFAGARAVRLGPVGLAGLWAAAELLRGYLFTGFPWALPAYIWLGTPVAFWSSVVGPYGLTALTFLCAALASNLLRRRNRSARVLAAYALAVAAFVAGGVVIGERARTGDSDIRIRIVQPNAPQHLKWDPAHIPIFFDLALQLSEASQADLVVWPETSLAQLLDFAEPELAAISARAGGQTVVLGARRLDGRRGYNSIAVVEQGGEIGAIYDKHHLVPFGEYLPLPKVLSALGLSTFTASQGYGFSAGDGPHLLDIDGIGRALPLICYEAIFPRDLRSAERPDFLLHLTNDAWFGTSLGPQQALAQARFRAIETGLPMARAANTGISGMINPRGEISASIPLGRAGAVTAALPNAAAPTLYVRFGEAGVLCLVTLCLLGGWVSRTANAAPLRARRNRKGH